MHTATALAAYDFDAEWAIWSFYRKSLGTWALNRGLYLYKS